MSTGNGSMGYIETIESFQCHRVSRTDRIEFCRISRQALDICESEAHGRQIIWSKATATSSTTAPSSRHVAISKTLFVLIDGSSEQVCDFAEKVCSSGAAETLELSCVGAQIGKAVFVRVFVVRSEPPPRPHRPSPQERPPRFLSDPFSRLSPTFLTSPWTRASTMLVLPLMPPAAWTARKWRHEPSLT